MGTIPPLEGGFLLLTAATGALLVVSFSFALLALGLRIRNDRAEARQARLRKRWEPAMLEILGGAAPPEAIFERIGSSDGVDFLEFLLHYARLLRGEEIALVRVMAHPYLPEMVPKLRQGTAESRGHAVLILSRLGMPEYADVVADALDDESPIVAMIAARSLFRPGHQEHFGSVLDHLPRFTGWSRTFLASVLAEGGVDAAPLLREILQDPQEDPLVRAVASDALRELNDLPSAPVARSLLEDAARPPERQAHERELLIGCLRILGHLGHGDHLEVIRIYTDAEDPVIRAAAVAALAALGGAEEAPLLQSKLDDDAFWVSLEAARGLMALGEARVLERVAATRGPWSLLARQVLTE